MGRGRGDSQDRRECQDYPAKHAHRNLVPAGAIEQDTADPRKVHLAALKKKCVIGQRRRSSIVTANKQGLSASIANGVTTEDAWAFEMPCGLAA
ncbi:hypothetical protein [Bradyrhizobium iriomotense]|uniref:hypothetical protein n=1 Tax=Bradyrhizobium iriomotense TaxID=441950 RepID=UPI0024E0F78C|nr:hypothetical protein [Bradyrhizobium iriomotense]